MASSPTGKNKVRHPGLASRRTWITGGVGLVLALAVNLYVANRESEEPAQTTGAAPSDTMQAADPAARTPPGVKGAM